MKQIFLVDLSKDASRFNAYLSETLLTKIKENIALKKKSLLYLNKRWEYNLLICQDCQHLYKCPACDIALWVHTSPPQLLCHHCGYHQELPLSCEKCQSTHLKKIWVGTQQIESSLEKLFPEAKLFRIDSDSTSNLTQKRETLEKLSASDIIIGTKMITTWFDFADIWVIGVVLLEQELQVPKYDTEEKIYSNIKQLIGRWWRSGTDTDIVIQTNIPNNQIIESIVEGNYKDFFKKILSDRKIFWYPPYCEMAVLRYKDKDKTNCKNFIDEMFFALKKFENPNIEITKVETLYKRDHQYFWKIILKGENIRDFLQNIKKDILKNKDLAVIFE